MSVNYNKIAKEIIKLYCENKPSKLPECENKECRQRRCLCIDEEQIRLISFFAGFDYDISLKDSQVIIDNKEKIEATIFCENDQNFRKRLIGCKGKNPEELKKLIVENRQFLPEQSFFKMIRALPLIQSINVLNNIDNRDTISYLCVYGKESGFFLKGLLSEMICQLIKEFIASKSSEDLVCASEKIFERIIDIFDIRGVSDFNAVFMQNIRDYIEQYREEKQSLILIANELEEYYDELVQKEENAYDACSFVLENARIEKDEILFCYRLFRQLMLITGLKPSHVLDDFFGDALKNIGKNKIYDEIQNILDEYFGIEAFSTKNSNSVKKYQILDALNKMFSEEDGMCDEALDELKKRLLCG